MCIYFWKSFTTNRSSGDTFQLLEEHFVTGPVTDIVDINVPDETFFIDDENCTLAQPLWPPYPVKTRGISVP